MIQFTDERMRKLIKEETEKFLNSPYDKSFDLVLEAKGSKRQRKKQAQKAKNQQITQKQQQAAAVAKNMASANKAAQTTPTQQQAAQAAAKSSPVPPGATPQEPMDEPDEPRRRTRTRTSREEYEEANPDVEFGQQDDDSDDESWMDKLSRFNKSDLNVKGGEAVTKVAKNVGGALKGLGYGAAKLGADATVGALGTAGKGLGALYRGLTGQSNNPAAKLQKVSKKAKKAGLDKQTIIQLAKLYRSGELAEKQIATLKLMERCLKSGKVKVIKEDKDPIIIDV
jgi:hypothetical protein